MDEQFRYGLVVRNSLVQHYVVMVVQSLPTWEHKPSGVRQPMAMAMILSDGSRHGARKTGEIVQISGKVGTEPGDWMVVE